MNKATLNTLLTAIYSLSVNKLRDIITMLIIALGIASLVGMQTAIDGLKWALVNNLNTLGNNTFGIANVSTEIKFGRRKPSEQVKDISYRDALLFRRILNANARVSLSASALSNAIARFKNQQTNANIAVIGSDEFYLMSSGFDLEAGRNFTNTEIKYGANVAIIGRELNDLLFSKKFLGVGKDILLSDRKFTIIGVTKAKGSSFGMSFDKNAIVPLQSARKNFATTIASNFSIKVTVHDVFEMENIISASTGAMRLVRKLKPGVENNFSITKSQSLQDLLEKNLSYVSTAAIIIGLITLSGALIALMNIMFVSITERTKEIGTRIAVGASTNNIKLQFLSEATIISLIGGIFGIILGLIIGNLVIYFLRLDANLPYMWILISFILCGFVGIGAGYLPAKKAAALDPIEALRYE